MGKINERGAGRKPMFIKLIQLPVIKVSMAILVVALAGIFCHQIGSFVGKVVFNLMP